MTEFQTFRDLSSIERAVVINNTIINEPYLGHSQILLVNNRNKGIFYSFEYDIHHIFTYDFYKKHPKLYNFLFYPISLLEQLSTLKDIKGRVRRVYLNEDQVKNLMQRMPVQYHKAADGNCHPEHEVWEKKQVNFLNEQVKNNNYPFMVFFVSPENGKKMFEMAETLFHENRNYNVLKNNCVHNVIQILKAGGINLSRTFLPYRNYLESLKQANEHESLYDHIVSKKREALFFESEKKVPDYTVVKFDRNQQRIENDCSKG